MVSANVAENEHRGLVPLSLYGDDVQAYRTEQSFVQVSLSRPL